MDKVYNPNIYEVDLSQVKLLVTASSEEHAIQRVLELLDNRITQYVHPDDVQPKFKVIALVEDYLVQKPAKRKRIIERHQHEKT